MNCVSLYHCNRYFYMTDLPFCFYQVFLESLCLFKNAFKITSLQLLLHKRNLNIQNSVFNISLLLTIQNITNRSLFSFLPIHLILTHCPYSFIPRKIVTYLKVQVKKHIIFSSFSSFTSSNS